VTTLQFATQHLCLIAERQLESLTEPIVSEGLVRYEVVGTCVQVSEESKKRIIISVLPHLCVSKKKAGSWKK
jgi:hypothetical protein